MNNTPPQQAAGNITVSSGSGVCVWTHGVLIELEKEYEKAEKMRVMGIARCLFLMTVCVLASACKREATDERAGAFVGVWEGQSQLIGGQGLAHVKIDLRKDGSFLMKVEVAEKAHFLNAYPTFDQIKTGGKWSAPDGSEIHLDGKIEEFSRLQIIGDAARQGFMPDDWKGGKEKSLVPLPFGNPPMLRASQDGGLYVTSVEFRGREADESDESYIGRMLPYVHLERVDGSP